MMLAAGCQAPPRVDLNGDAARAAGITAPIVFHSHGGPIDVGTPAGDTLDLESAVRRAIENDPRIQSALARIRAAEADARQARLLPNPLLNVDYRFPEGGGQGTFEATLSGDLLILLQKPSAISAADNRLRAASAEAVATVLDVILETQEAFVTVQSVDAELQVIEQRREILQRLLDLANARLRAGEGIRLDVLTLESQRLALEVELSQFRLERTEQRLVLARLMGEPSGAANWRLAPWQQPARLQGGEIPWLEAALISRPEIRSARWELAALGEDVRQASLSVLEGGEVGAHGERDPGSEWAVGPTVTVPVPIFDWGQARRRKAEALRVEARHKFTQLQRQVVEEVRRAYAVCVESQHTLRQAQEELIPLQQKRREQAELAYRSGEADLTTLLQAESDLQESRAKLVELQEQATLAQYKLHRHVGGAAVAASIVNPATLPASRPAETGITP